MRLSISVLALEHRGAQIYQAACLARETLEASTF